LPAVTSQLPEAHVLSQIELVHDVVQVALGLGLRREVFLPLPLVEELLGEEVAVGVALRVEPGARVAVPEPCASHPGAGLEQQDRETLLARPVELVNAGDASAHDKQVDVDIDGSRRGFGSHWIRRGVDGGSQIRGPYDVDVPGRSLPQTGFEETVVKPVFSALSTQKHVCARSCPKIVA
jgi:hypothetical protein